MRQRAIRVQDRLGSIASIGSGPRGARPPIRRRATSGLRLGTLCRLPSFPDALPQGRPRLAPASSVGPKSWGIFAHMSSDMKGGHLRAVSVLRERFLWFLNDRLDEITQGQFARAVLQIGCTLDQSGRNLRVLCCFGHPQQRSCGLSGKGVGA